MRVISQHNNCDIPYERAVIVCNMEYVIARIDGLEYTLGKYSSKEKALKVLDMIKKNTHVMGHLKATVIFIQLLLFRKYSICRQTMKWGVMDDCIYINNAKCRFVEW